MDIKNKIRIATAISILVGIWAALEADAETVKNIIWAVSILAALWGAHTLLRIVQGKPYEEMIAFKALIFLLLFYTAVAAEVSARLVMEILKEALPILVRGGTFRSDIHFSLFFCVFSIAVLLAMVNGIGSIFPEIVREMEDKKKNAAKG